MAPSSRPQSSSPLSPTPPSISALLSPSPVSSVPPSPSPSQTPPSPMEIDTEPEAETKPKTRTQKKSVAQKKTNTQPKTQQKKKTQKGTELLFPKLTRTRSGAGVLVDQAGSSEAEELVFPTLTRDGRAVDLAEGGAGDTPESGGDHEGEEEGEEQRKRDRDAAARARMGAVLKDWGALRGERVDGRMRLGDQRG